MLAHDALDRLSATAAPTLVITSDEIIPASNSQVLAERIPDRVDRRRAAGHLFFLERPEKTALLIEAFLT